MATDVKKDHGYGPEWWGQELTFSGVFCMPGMIVSAHIIFSKALWVRHCVIPAWQLQKAREHGEVKDHDQNHTPSRCKRKLEPRHYSSQHHSLNHDACSSADVGAATCLRLDSEIWDSPTWVIALCTWPLSSSMPCSGIREHLENRGYHWNPLKYLFSPFTFLFTKYVYKKYSLLRVHKANTSCNQHPKQETDSRNFPCAFFQSPYVFSFPFLFPFLFPALPFSSFPSFSLFPSPLLSFLLLSSLPPSLPPFFFLSCFTA